MALQYFLLSLTAFTFFCLIIRPTLFSSVGLITIFKTSLMMPILSFNSLSGYTFQCKYTYHFNALAFYKIMSGGSGGGGHGKDDWLPDDRSHFFREIALKKLKFLNS